MTLTKRQMIIVFLEKDFVSLQDISYKFGVDLKEIIDDFKYIKHAINKEGRNIVMLPAQCKACGFTFKERSKVKTPSKCPNCRHERIEAAKFKIE
ncbi:hypothetical protein ACFL1B_03655 [Nanoarchaeota archaeon]